MIALLRRADALLISLTRPLRHLDGLPALALRFYLVPVFWMAGSQKLLHFSDTVAWFGDPFQGLGLPLPWLLAALATASE
ncbi:DoxX family membrane protein, partial [Acinetobacter baumannii]